MDVMMKVVAPDVLWYQEFVFSVLMKAPGVQDVRSIVNLAGNQEHDGDPAQSTEGSIRCVRIFCAH
jgi:hypothetical protein